MTASSLGGRSARGGAQKATSSSPAGTVRIGLEQRAPPGTFKRRGKSMKAVFIDCYGGPEVLKYGDLPDPVPAPGKVIVDVVAASVNAADTKVRAGQYSQSKFPLVLGRDFSGVVSTAGDGVEDPKTGDSVFGVCDVGQEGAYAEKIAVKAAIVARKPDGLSHVTQACGSTLAAGSRAHRRIVGGTSYPRAHGTAVSPL